MNCECVWHTIHGFTSVCCVQVSRPVQSIDRIMNNYLDSSEKYSSSTARSAKLSASQSFLNFKMNTHTSNSSSSFAAYAHSSACKRRVFESEVVDSNTTFVHHLKIMSDFSALMHTCMHAHIRTYIHTQMPIPCRHLAVNPVFLLSS
jgi:hypothetical protein